ncbi:hypothetical protein N0V91_009259 [Didymella pomorum]|uniref:Uncharacterized protein n=1 Tax=Didymella pomorum TaxID=749634 RepID=A0A9W8Z7L2_9PLEO|nr:hypothetical protein N0V91_009259 [Didymella pomorum]
MPPSKRQRSGVNTSVARGLPAEDSASEDASSKKRGGLEDESGTSDADGEGSADDFDDCSGDEDEDEDKEEEYSSNSEEEEPAIRRLMSRVPHPECSRGFHDKSWVKLFRYDDEWLDAKERKGFVPIQEITQTIIG